MYLVVIAWLYVTLMMAIAEATNAQGSVLGAIVTFLLYGLAPMALVVYLMATPARKKALKAKEAAELADWQQQQQQGQPDAEPFAVSAASVAPDAGGHAPGAAPGPSVAPVRKET
jgi:hypothetical protein